MKASEPRFSPKAPQRRVAPPHPANGSFGPPLAPPSVTGATVLLGASLLICQFLSGTSLHAQGLSGVSGISQRLEEKVAVSFSKQVAPILNQRCGQCHIQGSKGNFRMATFADLMRARGAVTPGNPGQSKLYTLIERGEMPPRGGALPKEEQGVIQRWIEQGAKFDGTSETSQVASLVSTPQQGGGSSGPPAGYGGSSGPPAGYGGSSGPPAGYGGSSGPPPGAPGSGTSGPPAGYGGSSGPPAGYGGSSGPPAGYGGSSGPPAGYGGSSGPPAGYGGSSGPPPGAPGSGTSGPPAGYGGSSGPPAGYGGSSGPPPGYGDPDMEMNMDMDMGMEGEGYGYGYGGSAPGGRRSAAGTPRGDVLDTYASNLTSLFGSMDLSGLLFPGQDIQVESGPVLKREAEQAFQAGNQAVALELIFGHMATEYEEAQFDLQNVRYSALLKRPVWNIRWGVSMSVRGDEISDPQPIREGATPSRRIASRGGRGPGRGAASGGYDGGYEESMSTEDYEDQSGQQMEMEMQMEMEGYGQDLYGEGMEQQMRGRGAPQRPEAPRIPERKMLSQEAQEELDKHLGLVATVVSEEFNKRFQQGDFGTLFTSVTPPPEIENERGNRNAAPGAAPVVAQPSMSLALNDVLSEAGDPLYPMWQPGIVYLGQATTSDEILAAAKRANIDLVLHFDVILKQGRNEAVQNLSRCRLLQVSPPVDSQGRARNLVVTSKAMDSYEAQQFAAAGRMNEREYVTEQLSTLFSIIDDNVKVIDLPQLPAEVAKRRIATIISGDDAKSLRTLAEIRFYQSKNLIDDAEAEAAFDIVGGADGLLFLHGPKSERIETARRWAVQSTSGGSER